MILCENANTYIFLEYPKCTTCQKAKKWLENNKVSFESRHIVEANPSVSELEKWIEISGLPVKKFFNTSGMLYKQMNLKDKLETISDSQKVELLSTNGMLVKRPLIISKDIVLVGFKEDQWEKLKNTNIVHV